MRDAFIARLTELAEANPAIILVTGDLGFGVLVDFAKRFPKQYLNVGVAEQNMTGVATGLALEGRIAFTYSIANFPIFRCFEQLRNDACYHDANVKVVAIGGGFSYGALGMSHHATEDLSVMRALPNLTVVAPGDDFETKHATQAIVETPGTFYLRLDRAAVNKLDAIDEGFELGRARRIREGTDVTLISTGGILSTVVRAAEELSRAGIEARVLSMHTVKPLDTDAVVAACRETGAIVTVEEQTVEGGLGGAVAEVCLESSILPRRFHRVGLRAGFSSIVGSQEYLRRVYGMDVNAITDAVQQLLGGGSPTHGK